MNTEFILASASWCNPCKQLKVLLSDLPYSYKLLDVDTDYEEVSKLGIRGVPTLVKMVNGSAVSTLVGMQSKSTLQKFFEEV